MEKPGGEQDAHATQGAGQHKLARKRGRYRTSSRTVENAATGDLVVPGFLFYSYTKSRAVNAARMAAESVLEELEDTLEDALG